MMYQVIVIKMIYQVIVINIIITVSTVIPELKGEIAEIKLELQHVKQFIMSQQLKESSNILLSHTNAGD